MSIIELADLLEQDIRDLEGVFEYEKYDLSPRQARTQAKGILNNLKDHLEELISNYDFKQC